MAPHRTTVIIVEDDSGTREALRLGLQLDGFEVAGAFESGDAALAALPRLSPAVALVDLELPGMCGVETIRRLRQARPELAVLVLSVFETFGCRRGCARGRGEQPCTAFTAGAHGYLLKDTPLVELGRAIRQVLDGLSPIAPEVARHLLTQVRAAPPVPVDRAGPELSAREREVLSLLAVGHSYGDIAAALALQLATVQTHVKNIYRKLEVSTKAEAACLAVAHGLVCLPK